MMSAKSRRAPLSAVAAAALGSVVICASAHGAASSEARDLNELRNTVVNLLQALVERGVMTREQAEAMVTAAQKKASDDAAATEAQEKAEEGAVRVPYVPEIVKEEIRKQVTADLTTEVTKNVVEQAQNEQWGVPAALPDWVRRTRWYGDVRMRGQGDFFAPDNSRNYIDFQAVNNAGGLGRAGLATFLNTTEDRDRERVRLRLGLEAELGWGWSLGARVTSGNLVDPVSTNQTLGNYGARYQTGFDLGYIKWSGNSGTGRQVLNLWGGRIPNPWLGTELVWDPDLTFEGIAANYRFGLMRDDPYSHYVFATVGAFPLQEVELSSNDKWLYGGQLGLEWKFAGGSRARFGVAYYYYDNIVGQRNTLNSTLLDYTAPRYVQRGNTLFDIRNDTDDNTNLFALAADYHIADATMVLDWKLGTAYRLTLTGDYAKNLGLNVAEVIARAPPQPGFPFKKRDTGYQAELSFGTATLAQLNGWRAFAGYRYLEADSVLDAFTDSDFHLGGTDAKGYYIGVDYAFTPRVSTRIRYLSANEIDGEALGIDVLQLDLTASF